MSEKTDSEEIEEGSSSVADLFNELVKSIVEKQNPKVGVYVSNPDEQILVQNWLATKHTQDFLKQGLKGKYTSLGIVHRIDNTYGQVKVGLINKWGLFGFVYERGAEKFKEAQNGFKVGDVVLQEVDGTTINSVRPLHLSKEISLKVIDNIERLHDKISDST